MAARFGDALRPAVAGENAGGRQDVEQCLGAMVITFDEVADPAPQASGTGASAGFGADDPAPQFTPFLARQAHREGAVGGIQKMMALVEDIAGRNGCIVEPAECGLRHDQRMVGDDDARLARLADVLLDETAAKMRAGRVYALAPAISEPADAAAPNEFAEPPRKIAGHEISGLARADPPGDQPEMPGRPARPAHSGAERVLVIQQTKKILPSLADHDTAAFELGIGVEPVELASDLSLQVAGVSRDPDRAPVLLRPKTGGCDVAERLSGTCPGFGKYRAGLVGVLARRKGGGDCRGVIALLRPPLGDRAEQLGEPRASLLGPHRLVAGRRRRGRLGPFVEPYPHAQSGRLPQFAGLDGRQGGEHRGAPQPPAAIHHLGDRANLRVDFFRKLFEQSACDGREGDASLRRAARRRQAEGFGETARRRHTEPRRMNECEELEQIERGESGHIEPPCGSRAVAQHRRFVFHAAARGGWSKCFNLAVGMEPQHLLKTGDQYRRMWHQHPRQSIGGSGHESSSITSAARPSSASLRSAGERNPVVKSTPPASSSWPGSSVPATQGRPAPETKAWMRGSSPRKTSLGDYCDPPNALTDTIIGETLDLLHVLAFDADQPRRAVTPRRMQVAFIVEVGGAGF